MANTIGWGEGSINNTIGWGQATKNNTIGYGEMEKVSWTGETNITGISNEVLNKYSFDFDGVDDNIQSSTSYSELDSQTKASFSMWVKPTLSANAFALYVPSSPSARAYTIVIYNTGMIRHQIVSQSRSTHTNILPLSAKAKLKSTHTSI